MTAYYNEIEPYAAAWLRNLIAEGLIAPGDVDERDIRDVRPDELGGYTQCHFFAGIGVWSHALRLAGWPDDRPVWTGSCPCQPFSAAGRGAGFADERHLWPHWHHLISQCRPPVVFGEQVASKDGLGWLDLVQSDLEGAGYALGAADLCAAGVGAPHIRQRLWFIAERQGLAHADEIERRRRAGGEGLFADRATLGWEQGDRQPEPDRAACDLADAAGAGPLPGAQRGVRGGEEGRGSRDGEPERHGAACDVGDASGAGFPARERQAVLGTGGRIEGRATVQSGGPHAEAGRPDGGMADAHHQRREHEPHQRPAEVCGAPSGATGQWDEPGDHGAGSGLLANAVQPGRAEWLAGPTNGFWRDADWLLCRDGKWRPVEPSAVPLAHGATARVGRLRAYGNAISPYPAAEIIGSYLDIERLRLTSLSEMANDSDTQSGVFA